MKLISQPESFDSTSYPSFPFPLMLSNPPAVLLLFSLSFSRPLVRACRNSRSSTLCFFRTIHFPSASYDVDNSDSPGSRRPPPPRRCFIFTVPTNGRGPRPIADGNALEEIHVACKKNYDSSAFPPNSRLFNEEERCRQISRLLHGFPRTKKKKQTLSLCNLI